MSLPKFNIADYDGRHVMHCETQEEATLFVDFLDSLGLCWSSGRPYSDYTGWEPYGGGTCYRFTRGVRSQFNEYKSEDCFRDVIILEYSQFDWGREENREIISYEDIMG